MLDKSFWVESVLSWCNMVDVGIGFIRYDVKTNDIDNALEQLKFTKEKLMYLEEALTKLKGN